MDILRILALLLFAAVPLVVQAGDPIESMMRLWNYAEPKESAVFFTSLIEEASDSEDKDYLPAVLSQIARSYTLRRNLQAAHDQLDEVEELIQLRTSRGNIFYLLERGRTVNAGGDPREAIKLFNQAFMIAQQLEDDYLATDAAHMLAIVESLNKQHKWHLIALNIAENSESEFARDWLGTLYNNMGWTYFDQQQFVLALEYFKRGVEFRKQRGQARREQIARWAVARTLRALGQIQEAAAMQEKLLEEREAAGLSPDGQVLEELGEIYYLQQRKEARAFFARAYRILADDPNIKRYEPARLARLKELSTL